MTRLFAAGVTRTTIRGVAAPQTHGRSAVVKLIAFDVTMAQIAAAIAQEVDADPAGDVEGANARVRTGTAKRTPQEIAAITLRSNADGSKLLVGDVRGCASEGRDREAAFLWVKIPRCRCVLIALIAAMPSAFKNQVKIVAAELQASLPARVQLS